MWHDKNTQLKNFLWLHTVILDYFIYNRVKASQILYGGTIAVTPSQNWVEEISTHLMRKKKFCLSSSCLPSTHNKNHAYLNDSQYSTWLQKKYARLNHLLDSGHLQTTVKLLVNISSKFSIIIDYYEILTFLINEHKPR